MDEDAAALGCLVVIFVIASLTFSIWSFVKIIHIQDSIKSEQNNYSCEHLGGK